MKLSKLLSKPFKLKGGGVLNLKGFSKRVIDNEVGGGSGGSDSESINIVESLRSNGLASKTFSSLAQYIQNGINKGLEHRYKYILGEPCKLPDYINYDWVAVDIYDKEDNNLLFTVILENSGDTSIANYYEYYSMYYKIDEEYYDGEINYMPKAPNLSFVFYSKANEGSQGGSVL